MNCVEWVGVDTHKESLACYKGNKFKEFKTTKQGYESALKWAGKNSRWAIEGAYCFGKPFTAYLIKNGYEVFEVNPLLTKTWRRIFDINGSKNDYGDAKIICMLADNSKLQPVSLETVELKELLSTRNLLVKQRTEVINHLKMLFSTRGDVLKGDICTKVRINELINDKDILVKSLAKQLESLKASISEIEKNIDKLLPEKARQLTSLTGVGIINAAIIYTELKGRLISREALAKYAGIAPIENSSGKSNNHKNNKQGNRILNSVFYQVSLHQSRFDPLGKAYYQKKLAEGKTSRLARKCLSRRLVNIVWKILHD
jgi:transposase